jgi:phosphotransferase system  glucose/maltose/N-acetylglucosamine-specific IIC component
MPDVDAIERRAGRSSNGLMFERAEETKEETGKFFLRPVIWVSFGLVGAAAAIYFLVSSKRAKGVRYTGDEFFEVA